MIGFAAFAQKVPARGQHRDEDDDADDAEERHFHVWHGLAYEVSAFYPMRLDTSHFVAYMGTAPETDGMWLPDPMRRLTADPTRPRGRARSARHHPSPPPRPRSARPRRASRACR